MAVEDMFTSLVASRHKYLGDDHGVWIVAKQVLWAIADSIEGKLSWYAPTCEPNGIKRALAAQPSNIDASDIAPPACYSPSAPRKITSEIAKYFCEATRLIGSHPQPIITFAGPDSSKLGNAVNFSVAAIGNSRNGKVAVAAPQELNVFDPQLVFNTI